MVLERAAAGGRPALTRIRTGDARFESVGAFAVGFGAIGAGLWLWGLRHAGTHALLLFPVGLVAMVWALSGHPGPSRPRTAERIARMAAFRTFLRKFSDLPNAARRWRSCIWERYLEHATALGVADEVEKQVVALVPADSLHGALARRSVRVGRDRLLARLRHVCPFGGAGRHHVDQHLVGLGDPRPASGR